jgi:hypothetical protein
LSPQTRKKGGKKKHDASPLFRLVVFPLFFRFVSSWKNEYLLHSYHSCVSVGVHAQNESCALLKKKKVSIENDALTRSSLSIEGARQENRRSNK